MKSSIKAVNIAAALFVTLGVIAAPPQKGKPGNPGKPAVRDQQAPRPVKHTVRKTEVNSAAYQPARSEHMLVFTKRGAILFDQRVVGDREVRDRIKMLTHDRPLPRIIIRYENGVDLKRVDHVIALFRKAGFKDIRRERALPPKKMHGPKREKPSKWNPVNW